ncbi:MAG: 4-hydroxythreonine-4-phosphate dehydrogenase PdxA [Anaerolineae bacterium]|nr:4-hydroxythreonine-4-phosphate dehydrogenase PdxA [Anaerolineae bacterium]
MEKPIIGISMGDAAGIGPEIIAKLFAKQDLFDKVRLVVIGDADIMDEARKLVQGHLRIHPILNVNQATFEENTIDVIDLDNLSREYHAIGKVDAAVGRASVEYLLKAVELVSSHQIHAITSAPLNKEAMHLAGSSYPGQTELLADVTKSKRFGMMLLFGPIKMFYVTNHVSLRTALEKVKRDTILERLVFIDEVISEFREEKPIAVAALNPHAGENGSMGMEEITEIIPAIEEARKRGINVVGPVPADTIFVSARQGIYGAVLAMYHDQGNIAAKLLNFGSGVTYVSGLPFVRTSVAHGTAFDIAGRGVASPDTLYQAVVTAAELFLQKSSLL